MHQRVFRGESVTQVALIIIITGTAAAWLVVHVAVRSVWEPEPKALVLECRRRVKNEAG